MRRAITLLVLSLAVASCGGSDDADETAEPTTAATAATAATTAAAPGDDGRAAQAGDTVSVHYTGTLDDGSQFDTSRDGDPLQFVIGSGQLIDGFDQAVQGLRVGETVTVRLAPAEAYGDYQDDLLQEVPLENLPEGVAAGDELVSPQGQRVVVTEVADDVAIVDFNHSLAGEHLTFEITLVSFDS